MFLDRREPNIIERLERGPNRPRRGRRTQEETEVSTLTLQIPRSGPDSYTQTKIVIHFSEAQNKTSAAEAL